MGSPIDGAASRCGKCGGDLTGVEFCPDGNCPHATDAAESVLSESRIDAASFQLNPLLSWTDAVREIGDHLDIPTMHHRLHPHHNLHLHLPVRAGHILRGAMYYFVEANHEDLNIAQDEIIRRAHEFADIEDLWMILDEDLSTPKIKAFAAIQRGKNRSTAHVGTLRLAVDKDCWNEGLGTRLIEHAVERAMYLGVRRLEAYPYLPLSPWKYHLFIDKGGFEIESVKKQAVRPYNGGPFKDMLCLVRFFKAPRKDW